MKRHEFSLESLAFGLFFLAVIGQWAVWRAKILSPDQLAYVAAGSLIVLGIVGILASLTRQQAKLAETPDDKDPAEVPTDDKENPNGEEADAQS